MAYQCSLTNFLNVMIAGKLKFIKWFNIAFQTGLLTRTFCAIFWQVIRYWNKVTGVEFLGTITIKTTTNTTIRTIVIHVVIFTKR